MTSVTARVKSFLEKKIEENKVKKAHIARGAGVSTFTIQHIMTANLNNNVSFKVILKLANYFKCTIDEVLGRDKFKDIKASECKPTTFESSMERVKEFIRIQMIDLGLDAYKFAGMCGLERGAVRSFIMNTPSHSSIETNKLLAIADTFNASIDELIGRTEINPSLLKSKEKTYTPSTNSEISRTTLKNLPAQTVDEIKNIQKTLEGFQPPLDIKINVNNLHNPEIKKYSHSR